MPEMKIRVGKASMMFFPIFLCLCLCAWITNLAKASLELFSILELGAGNWRGFLGYSAMSLLWACLPAGIVFAIEVLCRLRKNRVN
jgi:hypothetical protein